MKKWLLAIQTGVMIGGLTTCRGRGSGSHAHNWVVTHSPHNLNLNSSSNLIYG